tara:strand:- start:145 stop:1041 length:897 start_codon:yes stop_codon:yes gene_type:complete
MLYIYTVCYNTPDFIEPQYTLLKKFIKDEFEFIVFNNTITDDKITDVNMKNNTKLKDICEKHSIKFYDIPREIFASVNNNDASRRAGTAIDFSNKILFNIYGLDNWFFLLDSDAFLVSDFHVESFMGERKIGGRIQYRNSVQGVVKYLSNQIVIYKPSLFDKEIFLKNFSFLPCSISNANCDCGGRIHYIFQTINLKNDFVNFTNALFSNEGNVKQLFGGSPVLKTEFNVEYLNELDPRIKEFIITDTKILQRTYPFAEIFAESTNSVHFIHLRAGTNWINYDIIARKSNLHKFFKMI